MLHYKIIYYSFVKCLITKIIIRQKGNFKNDIQGYAQDIVVYVCVCVD